MSSMQKALKILSILALLFAADLAITLFVLRSMGDAPEPAQTIAMGVTMFFGCVVFKLGIRAANVPAYAVKMLPFIILALLVNAADVVLAIQSGLALASVCANALVAVGIAFAAHKVNAEHLGR